MQSDKGQRSGFRVQKPTQIHQCLFLRLRRLSVREGVAEPLPEDLWVGVARGVEEEEEEEACLGV